MQTFIDYAATQPFPILMYQSGNTVLDIYRDASHLNESKACSRVGGHNFLSRNAYFLPNNGAVLNISQIIKSVISLDAKSKLGIFFINAKYAVPVRKTLEDMEHPHPLTPTQTDNSTAYGVGNKKIHPEATKSTDMRFHWLRDRECQKIPNILETRHKKIGQLLDEASLR